MTVATLTAADRCDRCNAQAYVRAELPSGLLLLMCAHHGSEHIDALLDAGARVVDDSGRVLRTPVET